MRKDVKFLHKWMTELETTCRKVFFWGEGGPDGWASRLLIDTVGAKALSVMG